MSWFEGEVRDPGPVPEVLVAPLRDQTASLGEDWSALDAMKPNRFECFAGSTDHVVMQYPRDSSDPCSSFWFPWWRLWSASVEPVLVHVRASIGAPDAPSTRVMLARLRAGGCIAPHVDGAGSARLPRKIHVPLISAPEVLFQVGGGQHHLSVGRAWEVNNRIKHGVRNGSGVDRIHLIFDLLVDGNDREDGGNAGGGGETGKRETGMPETGPGDAAS